MNKPMWLVKGWGETELPEVFLVETCDEALQCIVSLQYDDWATCDPEEYSEASSWVDFSDYFPQQITFEIGGISIERVFYNTGVKQ